MTAARSTRWPETRAAPPSLLFPLILLLSITIAATVARASTPWPHTRTALNQTSSAAAGGGLGVSKKYEGSSEFVHLQYHMGPVLTANITVHPIWYGVWPAAQKRILRSFIRSISPDNAAAPPVPEPSVAGWWRTVQLYTDQTGSNVSRTVRLGAEKNDRRCSEGKQLTRLSIQSVIRSAVTAKTRPLPINPKGGLYLLLTSADVGVEDFCGQVCGSHYFTFPSIVGYTLPYAWVGNSAARCPGSCAWPFAAPEFPGAPPGGRKTERPPNGDVGVDGMVSVVGHELAEMATNPLANAWYAGGDPCFPQEIADLCEGIYGTGGGGAYAGQLLADKRSGAAYNAHGVGGRKFLVQWIWSPVLSYCAGPNAVDQ